MLQWCLFFSVAFLWAFSFTAIEIVLTEINPLALVFWRLFFAAIFVTVLTLIMGYRFPSSVKFWSRFALLGFFGHVLPFCLISLGQQYIEAGLSSILIATTPIFTALLAHFISGNEPMHLLKGLGLLCGFFGVVTIFGLDAATSFDWRNIGQFYVLLAALCYAIAFIFAKKYSEGINAFVSTAAMLICSSVTMFIVVFLGQESFQYARSWEVWTALLVMSGGGTGIAYIIYYYLLSHMHATNVSLVTFIVPPMAVFIGWLFLHEIFAGKIYIGMGLILLSLLLIDSRMKRYI